VRFERSSNPVHPDESGIRGWEQRRGNKKNTTSSVNDCTVEDVELLTSPTEC